MKIPLIIATLALLQAATAFATPINEWCPVTPDEPAESHLTIEFEGQTIGFCCRACVRKFVANPEPYRANLPLSPSTPTPSPTASHEQPMHPEIQMATSPSEPISLIERTWRLLSNLHILAVHFPIALFIVAAPFELAAVLRRSTKLAFVSRANFLIGSVSALLAAALGWIAAANSHYTGDAASLLDWHRWLGTSSALIALFGVFGLILESNGKTRGTLIFQGSLVALLVLIPIAAHFGGSLIYGPDHLSL